MLHTLVKKVASVRETGWRAGTADLWIQLHIILHCSFFFSNVLFYKISRADAVFLKTKRMQ